MTQNNLNDTFQGRFGNLGYQYDVDIVLCIDATKSMLPVIQMVKDNAIRLPVDFLAEAQASQKKVDNFRMKVLLFRDYMADGEYAMETTDFMTMPEQKELFNEIVGGIIADGGGDEPEDGLEALAYAMASDWQAPAQNKKRRQIIVVWTDASTHKLGYGRESEHYDPDLPTDFETLTDWWGDDEDSDSAKMDYNSKRLLLFAPKAAYWTNINENWDNVIFIPTKAGEGLKEHQYDTIIKLLVGSI